MPSPSIGSQWYATARALLLERPDLAIRRVAKPAGRREMTRRRLIACRRAQRPGSQTSTMNDQKENHMVSERPKRLTPFETWVQDEGLKVITAHTIKDIVTEELAPWERTGCDGALLDLTHDPDPDVFINNQGTIRYLVEIPPGGTFKAERHMYEEIFYVAKGRGATVVWYDGSPKAHLRMARGQRFRDPAERLARALQRQRALMSCGSTQPRTCRRRSTSTAVPSSCSTAPTRSPSASTRWTSCISAARR